MFSTEYTLVLLTLQVTISSTLKDVKPEARLIKHNKNFCALPGSRFRLYVCTEVVESGSIVRLKTRSRTGPIVELSRNTKWNWIKTKT